MGIEIKPRRSDPWINPPSPDDPKDPGYEDYVRAKIARGRAQLDAGEGIPAEDVWKDLGIE